MFYYIPPQTARRILLTAFIFLTVSITVALSGPPARADAYQDYQAAILKAQTAEQAGDGETAFREYEMALIDYPNADLPRDALVAMFGSGLPQKMDLRLLSNLPSPLPPCEMASFTIPSGDLKGQQSAVVIPAGSLDLKEATDPENGWPFAHVLYVYRASSAGSESAELLCAVHFQVNDDQALAQHVGTLLFLLREAYVQETGDRPVGDQHSFDVWLCRRSPDIGGGEEWHGNLYFYNTGDPRSSIEWIREIAHEYSHLAFAAIGGDYTQPEAWANGYIGERILVRWLSRDAAGGPPTVEQAWGGTFSGYPNFARLLITPPEQLYETQGQSDAWLARRDAEGMRYVIGFLLWVDDHEGPRFLGNLLSTLTAKHETSPQDLYQLEVAIARHGKRPSAGARTLSGRSHHQSA